MLLEDKIKSKYEIGEEHTLLLDLILKYYNDIKKYNYKYGIMPNIYLIIFLFSKDSINISNKKISINKDKEKI